MRNFRFFLLIISFVSLFFLQMGCSNSGGQSNKDKDKKSNPIEKLSPEHKAQFLAWQNKIVKSCHASELFYSDKENPNFINYDFLVIDAEQWLSQNEQLYKLEMDGNVFIFDRPMPFPSSQSSILETETSMSISVNDKVVLDVKAQIKNSVCTVKLFDEVVFEKKVAQNLGLALAFLKEESNQNLNDSENTFNPEISKSSLSMRHLFNNVKNKFEPSKKSYQWLAKQFNINEDKIEKIFPSIFISQSDFFTFSVPELNSSLWYSEEYSKLFLNASKAADFITQSGPYQIDMIYKPRDTFFYDYKTSDLPQGFLFQALIDINKSNDPWTIKYKGIDYLGPRTDDKNKGKKCVLSRYDVRFDNLGLDKDPNVFLPSFDETFSPCLGLDGNLENNLFSDKELYERISKNFKNMTVTKPVNYNQWDQFVFDDATTWALNGVHPDEHINPAGAPVISRLSSLMMIVHYATDEHPHRNKLILPLFEMVSQWAFYFTDQLESVERIFSSLAQIVDPFEESAFLTIQRFKYGEHEALDALQDLEFADAMTAEFVNLMKSIKAQALDLSYQDWIHDVFNQVLQKRPSLQSLKNTNNHLIQISKSMKEAKNLSSHQGTVVSFAVKHLELEKNSLTINLVQEMISALNHVIEPFQSSTETLIQNLSKTDEPISYWNQIDFAQKMTDEYKKLFLEMKKLAVELKKENWVDYQMSLVLQNQPSLNQVKDWHASFKSTSNFARDEEARAKNSSDDFGYESSLNKIIERALDENWVKNDFSIVVDIAKLAQTDPFCEKNKTYSKCLNGCGKFHHMSKNQDGFLYPNFNNRYQKLAKIMLNYILKAKVKDEYTFTQVSNDLRRSYFGSYPIWISCDNALFVQKQKDLEAALAQLLNETDWFKQNELIRQIGKLLKDCF